MATFNNAFASARKAGKKTFRWNGKLYNTKLKSESAPAPKAKPSSAPTPTAKPASSAPSASRGDTRYRAQVNTSASPAPASGIARGDTRARAQTSSAPVVAPTAKAKPQAAPNGDTRARATQALPATGGQAQRPGDTRYRPRRLRIGS